MKKMIIKMISLILAINMVLGGSEMVFAQNVPDASTVTGIAANIDTKMNFTKFNPNICLDRDDFDTQEEYDHYVMETGDTSAQYPDLSASIEMPGISIMASGTDYGKQASMRYSIKGLVKHKTAIQKAYIGSAYIYLLQRSGKNMYLTRCTISGNKAEYKDEMTLTNFGHSQTLEWFEYKGKAYFWIACKASDVTTQNWSTQIGRLEYKAGISINYTQIKRFSSLSKANKKGSANGTIKRVDAALSSDKSILLIWSRNTNNVMQFSFYNASKVNAALSNSSTNYVSCDSTAIKNACISSFTMKNTFLPEGSCQGLEVSNAKSIYMASGGNQATKWIFKLNSTGKVIGKAYIKNPALKRGTNTEIEGLQLKDDDICFGLCNHDDKKNGIQYIYSLSKNVF